MRNLTSRYHDLNVYHEYWDVLLSGDRTFDIRLDDRGFQRGDIVVYHKLEKGSKIQRDEDYSPVQYRITWILSGGKFGLEAGHVAFSIEPTYDIVSDGEDSGGPTSPEEPASNVVPMNEREDVLIARPKPVDLSQMLDNLSEQQKVRMDRFIPIVMELEKEVGKKQ